MISYIYRKIEILNIWSYFVYRKDYAVHHYEMHWKKPRDSISQISDRKFVYSEPDAFHWYRDDWTVRAQLQSLYDWLCLSRRSAWQTCVLAHNPVALKHTLGLINSTVDAMSRRSAWQTCVLAHNPVACDQLRGWNQHFERVCSVCQVIPLSDTF